MSACLADNHDAHEDPDDDEEDEDVKLGGKLGVREVYCILRWDPAKHKDETYIQRRVRMSAETAMHFMKSDNMDTTSKDCKVACQEHSTTVTREMKKTVKNTPSRAYWSITPCGRQGRTWRLASNQ